MSTSKVITEELRKKYLSELERDAEKDFSSEFDRTTNLEASLIREYGFDGLKLILPSKKIDDIYQLGSIPEDCLWVHLNSKTPTEAIDAVFSSIKEKVPSLIASMKDRVRFVYATRLNSNWELNYLLDMKLYDGRDYFLIYSGGAPDNNPQKNDSLTKFEWAIPQALKEFYSIHNGFGALEDSVYILSSKQISIMGEMMNPISKEQNVKPEEYLFNDLLEFFPDGAGNAQCFLRKGDNNNNTVDWDHETWEISEETDFFDFVDNRMSELDEE